MSSASAISHGEKSSAKGERGLLKRLAALENLTPLSGRRLLDIGCADGSYTRRLARGFEQVDAIDVEPDRLGDFRASLIDTDLVEKIRIAEMSADDLGFDSETFDVVTAIEVIEHVSDLQAVFSEVARVLQPEGRFLITTPNKWFPFETHGPLIRGKRRKAWSAPGLTWISPVHRRCSDARVFTRTDLVRRGEEAGLRISGHSYMMPPFDAHPIGRRIRPATDAIERTPLSFFGMAHVLVLHKP